MCRCPWHLLCESEACSDLTPFCMYLSLLLSLHLAPLPCKASDSYVAVQAPGSSALAVKPWAPAGAFEAYWEHKKTYSSNVPSGTRSAYWDLVNARNSIAQSGSCSKAAAQKPSDSGGTAAADAVQPALQHVQPLTLQLGGFFAVGAHAQPGVDSSPGSSAASALHLELAKRQSSHSSAQSQGAKVGWSQQIHPVELPPLQAYEPNQMAQAGSTADAGGGLPGAMTAAQQLSAHDVFRRGWVPGSSLHVTWQEDPSFMPTDELVSGSASSLASFRSVARSMLSGAAVGGLPPAAGAQLPVSRQQPQAASRTPPSAPATLTLPAPSTAALSPAVESCAIEEEEVRSPCSAGVQAVEPPGVSWSGSGVSKPSSQL